MMSDAEEPNIIVRREKPVTKLPWYDARGLRHPLSDEDFINAYCEHVLCTTEDHSVKIVRNRAYKFIRNFMAPEIEKALAAYRKTYK
jgi:hypothetical protein